jgi:hypothetical protein
MLHFVAIVEDAGPEKAVGVCFLTYPAVFQRAMMWMRHCGMPKRHWRSTPKPKQKMAVLFPPRAPSSH